MTLHPLPDNGTIGVMAPSSPVEEDKLENGIRYLENLGYKVRVTDSCYSRDNYLAGSASRRASELMDLIQDKTVNAIFFARGGFGSAAMLPLLDYDAIRNARKLMVGYSDITALQWGIYAKTGLPSLSTGMPATDFDSVPVNPVFEHSFWKFIKTGKIDYSLQVKSTRKEGTISGISLPGTLSVATKLAGSAYFPDLKQSILILEDVGESRHKVEGYLWQAKMAGWFDRASAVIFGDFSEPEHETFPDNPSLDKVFDRIFEGLNIPVIRHVPYGHIDDKIPFPLGVELSLSFGSDVKIYSQESLFDI